ncbi:hypothetical protein CAPTEDRAFT_225101 [Capitella teleta]|uniref:VWFA domain-containing protein n=1 Tax=Capitella teleta TaxID=283909 RepID=R7T9S0_CAPTE|nr:hypothetical protein CAPTEDRAFT_225101 [Capitella teleta]|eukprot:ELT90257.1 hypothetical protein CAPTEDRAFT_225101 [Capitella teleta]
MTEGRHTTMTRCLTLLSVMVAMATANDSTCDYDYNQKSQRNVVFLFDTSESVGKTGVDNGKAAVKRIITTSLLLRNEDTRIAVLTFNKDVKVVLDSISEANDVPFECALFAPGGLWDSITFANQQGGNIGVTLQFCEDIVTTPANFAPPSKDANTETVTDHQSEIIMYITGAVLHKLKKRYARSNRSNGLDVIKGLISHQKKERPETITHCGALTRASKIFVDGRPRRDEEAVQAEEDLFIITDAHELNKTGNINSHRNQIHNFTKNGVNVYGIGVGTYLKKNTFKGNFVSKQCMYRNHSEWLRVDLSSSKKNASKEGGLGEWRKTNNNGLCKENCESHDVCACREFKNSYDGSSFECRHMAMSDENVLLLPLLIVLFILLAIFFFLAVGAAVKYIYSVVLDRKKPFRHMENPQSPSVDTNVYNRNRSHNQRQEELYANGIVATILQAHGLPNGVGEPRAGSKTKARSPRPQAEQDNLSYAYIDPAMIPNLTPTDIPQANGYIDVLEEDQKDDTHDYVNEEEITAAFDKYRHGLQKQQSQESNGYLKPAADARKKKKGSTKKEAYVNADVIAELSKQPKGKRSLFKMGTTRFKNIKSLVESQLSKASNVQIV